MENILYTSYLDSSWLIQLKQLKQLCGPYKKFKTMVWPPVYDCQEAFMTLHLHGTALHKR